MTFRQILTLRFGPPITLRMKTSLLFEATIMNALSKTENEQQYPIPSLGPWGRVFPFSRKKFGQIFHTPRFRLYLHLYMEFHVPCSGNPEFAPELVFVTIAGERPFVCTICNRAFNQKNALQMHLKKHSGDKSHKCPYCMMAFVQKGLYN